MIIVGVMNGWSASVKKTRTSRLVKRLMDENFDNTGEEYKFRSYRSVLWKPIDIRSQMMRRYVRRNQSSNNTLLLVGKSLGARNMVKRVLNPLQFLCYAKMALVTIDPCWPIKGDPTPNLNSRKLVLITPCQRVDNIYLVAQEYEQAGARVFTVEGPNATNIAIPSCPVLGLRQVSNTHQNIIEHPIVLDRIKDAIAYLGTGR